MALLVLGVAFASCSDDSSSDGSSTGDGSQGYQSAVQKSTSWPSAEINELLGKNGLSPLKLNGFAVAIPSISAAKNFEYTVQKDDDGNVYRSKITILAYGYTETNVQAYEKLLSGARFSGSDREYKMTADNGGKIEIQLYYYKANSCLSIEIDCKRPSDKKWQIGL